MLLLVLTSSLAGAFGDGLPSAERLRELWHGRLDGAHFHARIRLSVARGGKHEEREIGVWRDDEPASHQERLMARFRSPPDLRGLALLYIEQLDRPNDYFVYQPDLNRVRRLPGRLARADVYGVDLEYLGFGVAQIEPTGIESIELVELDGRRTVRVRESARRFNQRFDVRWVWLDPETWIPLRMQHLRRGRVTMDARTHEVRVMQGITTPMRVTFDRPLEAEVVTLTVDEIDYVTPIPESHFSTLKLIPR